MLQSNREPPNFVMVPVPEGLEEAIKQRMFQLVIADAVDLWERHELEQFYADSSEDEARLIAALIPASRHLDPPLQADLVDELEMSEDDVGDLIDALNLRATEAGARVLVLDVPGLRVGNHALPPTLVIPKKAAAMLADIIGES